MGFIEDVKRERAIREELSSGKYTYDDLVKLRYPNGVPGQTQNNTAAESSGKWASPMNQAMQKSATVNQALREGRSLQSVLDSLPKTENRMSGADYLFARAGHGVVGSVKGLVNQSDAERLYLAENAVDLVNGGGFRNPKGFDALDMDAAMRVSSAFSQGLREGVDKEMILERQRQTMADRLGNRRIDNFYNKQTQRLEEAKAYQTPGVQKAGNIAEIVGQMALPVVASFLPGGQLLGTFGSSMSAAGNTTMNALEQGAETETALQAGYLTGAKEAAVESLFGGILGRGVGLLDSTGKRLLSPKVLGALQEFGNTALGRVVRKAAASGEEGLEEVLSAYLDPYIARATYDEDAGPVTFQELKDNFGMGFIVSFLLGGIPGKKRADSNVSIDNTIDNTDTAASLLRLYEEYQQEQMQRRYQQASGRTDYVNARPVRFQASSVGGPVQPNVQPNYDLAQRESTITANIDTPRPGILVPQGFTNWFDNFVDELGETLGIDRSSLLDDDTRAELVQLYYDETGRQPVSEAQAGNKAFARGVDWYTGATGVTSSAMNDVSRSVVGLLPQTTAENNIIAPIQQGQATIPTPVDNSAVDNSTSVLYGDPFGNIRKTPEDPLLLPEGGRSEDVSFDQWLDEMISTETDPDKKYSLQLIREYLNQDAASQSNSRSFFSVDDVPVRGYNANEGGIQNATATGIGIDTGGHSIPRGASGGTGGARQAGAAPGGRLEEGRLFPGGDRARTSISLDQNTRNTLQKHLGEKYIETNIEGSDNAAFSIALQKGRSINPDGWRVDEKTVEDLENARAKTFLTPGGHAGVAVTADGDIIGVFSDGSQRKVLPEMMLMALQNGGVKLDAYDGRLSRLYTQYGFVPVAKTPFSPEIAGANGWDSTKHEMPKWVVAWIHNGDSPEVVAGKIGDYPSWNIDDDNQVKRFDDYNDMLMYRDGLINRGQTNLSTDGPQDLSDADTPPTDTLALNLLHSTQEKQSVKDRVKSGVANLRRRLVNIGDSMERIDKLVGGHRNRNNYQNVIQARNRANFAIGEQGARRNGGYQTDLQGNRMGDSLADIFAPIHSQGEAVAQEFQDYLRHWHNIDRMAVKKPVFDESVTADVSREKIAEYEAAHPEFRESAEKVWAYNANLIEILVEGGVLDRGTANLLHNMYPHYVPSHVDGNTTGPYASIHNTQSGVLQKATGKKDAAAMRPIHEIMARQTINVYRQTAMNQLGNSLLDSLLSGVDGVRQYLDVTSTKSDAVDMRLGILDETLTQEDYKAGLNKDGTLTFYRNGEKTTVALSKDVVEALNGLFKGTDFFDSTTGKALTAPATIMRNLITTYNPAFTAANFLRDAGDSLLFTKSLPHFIQAYPQAIQEILKNGELFQKYQALGGFSSGMFDSRTGAFDSGNLGLQTPGQKTKGKVKQNTVGRIEALNSIVEQIPRFTEFLATLNRTGDFSHDGLLEAMYNAADITVNFGRSGDVGKTVNRFTPFFNAAIQGLDKVVRTAVETKSGKTWLRMIGVATVLGFIPQAINEALYGDDEEYQNIPLRDKANNYLFRMPNGNYIKLPKGRMIAALSGLGQSVINLFDGRDPEFEESLSLIIDNLAPQSPIENNMLYAFQRADLFDPESQGKTWFGGDIETQSDLNTAPKYRYDENTSRWMVALGQATGLSPKKLQDLFETYSGVIGDVAVPLTTPAAEKGAFGGLFRNRFTLDPTYSNTLSSDFYDAKQEYAWSKNDPSADLQEREISATVSRFINNKQSEISGLYDEIEAVQNSNLPDREKLEQVDNLRDQINEVYREALQAMPGYEEAATNLYDTTRKKLSLGTNPQRETSDDLVDELYLLTNREAFGSEYALQEYNKDVYEAAQELNRKDRISYDRIFDFYMHVRQVRDEGLTGSEENAKIREYILGVPGLSSQQKQALDESFLSDGRWIPTDMQVDYSDEESFFITQLSSGAQKAWDRFGRYADWEVDPETFSELWDVGHTDGVSKDEKLELWRAMTGWNDSRLQTFWNIMQGNKGYE